MKPYPPRASKCAVLEDQRLDSAVHDCADFDCGVKSLNDYLTRYARQDRRRNLSQIYVLVETKNSSSILGYYTLSAAQAGTEQLDQQDRRRLPGYPIPCFRMGRFAVRQDVQGRGIAKLLLGCAVDRCLQASREVAAYALIVDAKDATARSFYERFGFVRFADTPSSLYLALSKPDSVLYK